MARLELECESSSHDNVGICGDASGKLKCQNAKLQAMNTYGIEDLPRMIADPWIAGVVRIGALRGHVYRHMCCLMFVCVTCDNGHIL